jgi:hypothetical protein
MAGYYNHEPRNDFILPNSFHFSDTFHFDLGQPKLSKGDKCFQSFPEGVNPANCWVLVSGNPINGSVIVILGSGFTGEFQLNTAIPRPCDTVHYPSIHHQAVICTTAGHIVHYDGRMVIQGDDNISNPQGTWEGSFCYLAYTTDGEGFDPPLAPQQPDEGGEQPNEPELPAQQPEEPEDLSDAGD